MFMFKREMRHGAETDSSSLHLLRFQRAISRRHGSQFQKASAQVVHARAKNFGFILIPVLFPPFSRSRFSPDFFFRSQRFGNYGYFPLRVHRTLFCPLSSRDTLYDKLKNPH